MIKLLMCVAFQIGVNVIGLPEFHRYNVYSKRNNEYAQKSKFHK